MKTPKISVIIPVYNSEEYLRDCLDSVLNQSFSDFELILIDDGSTDSSRIICEEYAKNDNRIQLFHQENKGQAAARNFAVEIAKTRWVAFVDSDDLIHPQYLERLYSCIKPGINMCCCNVIKGNKPPDFQMIQEPTKSRRYIIDELALISEVGNGYSGQLSWAKIVEKSIINKYPFTEGRIYEDNAVVKKWLFEANDITILEEPLYFYRENDSGTTRSDIDLKKVEDALWSRNEIIDFYKEKGLLKAYAQTERDYVLFATNIYYKYYQADPVNAKELKKNILKRYSNDKKIIHFSKEDKYFMLELKYPKVMRFYWKIKGIM